MYKKHSVHIQDVELVKRLLYVALGWVVRWGGGGGRVVRFGRGGVGGLGVGGGGGGVVNAIYACILPSIYKCTVSLFPFVIFKADEAHKQFRTEMNISKCLSILAKSLGIFCLIKSSKTVQKSIPFDNVTIHITWLNY